jgi:hypothetical protein
MQNWLLRETQKFAKQRVSFVIKRNSFLIEFHETKSETSFKSSQIFLVALVKNFAHELITLICCSSA